MPAEALGGRSFTDTLGDALRAAQTVSRDRPPQVVILTGGASRMAFFQRACREAFADSLLVLCPEPECSIARGLAYCGRVDERLALFRQETASIARGDRLSAAVSARVHELYQPLAAVLFDAALSSALETVGLWRSGGLATIEELDSVLADSIRRAFEGEQVRERMQGPLRTWTEGLMRDLENELTSLCVRCGVPPEHMSLSGARLSTGVGGVKLSMGSAMGMDVISGLLGVVLAAVGASICGGGGVALVSAGPVGMLTGAVAGVLLALLGRPGLERALRTVRLPVLMRQLVTDGSVRRGLLRQRQQTERAIIAALADPANGFAAGLCQSLSQTLGEQLERMARDAEMRICA